MTSRVRRIVYTPVFAGVSAPSGCYEILTRPAWSVSYQPKDIGPGLSSDKPPEEALAFGF